MYVGTLTADEISFAGVTGSTNYTHYLMNNYAKTNNLYWWTLSPSGWVSSDGYDYAFDVHSDGSLSNNLVYDNYSARSSINLKNEIEITGGNGTISNPYEIK